MATRGNGKQRLRNFPTAGIDLVEHDLRVDLDIGATGQPDEILVFNGRMVIERGDPYIDEAGRRQIDFYVRSWVATAFSRVFKQQITYILSEDVEQPVSKIISEKGGRDFPATFLFNVVFDVRVGNQTVFRKHEGRPEGHGFTVVPPDGNRRRSPTITAFEPTRVAVEHPKIGVIQLTPRDCNDRKSQTMITFADAEQEQK